MAKAILTVVLPNTIESINVATSSDDTIETVLVLLTNNGFIDGGKFYAASIRNQGKNVEVKDFQKKLNELGVYTDAYLFISLGSDTDYKTPPAPPISSNSTTPLIGSSKPNHAPHSKPIAKEYGAMKILFLNENQIPGKCLSCEQMYWLQERLGKGKEASKALREKDAKLQHLSKKLENKKDADWFAIFGTTIVTVGQIINSNIPSNQALGMCLTMIGIVLAYVSLVVSQVKFRNSENIQGRKGTKKNG